MGWLLLIFGAVLLWAGWDALVHLGAVRPLSDRELARAVRGHGESLSDAGKMFVSRIVPAHNSLERLLASVFVLVGFALVASGGWLLWNQ